MDETVSGAGYSGSMTDSPVRPLAEWAGRILLLLAVVFWWGAVVIPRLVSIVFPDFLPPNAAPHHLNPDQEGTAANAVSAFILLIAALLAFANAHRSFDWFRMRTERTATLGWTALAATAAFLAWEEIAEFKLAAGIWELGKGIFGTAYRGDLWTVLASPLIVAFVLVMGVFVGKGLPSTGAGREVRALLILGLTAWVLAVVYEMTGYFVFGEAHTLPRLIEETLEFGGTLTIGLSAAIALRAPAVPRPVRQAHDRQARNAGLGFDARDRFGPKVWLLAAMAGVVGMVALGVVAAAVHREPLADARALTHVGAFQIILRDKHSLVQELGAVSAPLARLGVRVANIDRQGNPGGMLWRVMEAGEYGSGRILREGRLEVAAGEHPEWMNIEFPPLVEAEGRPLALQLMAEVEPNARLRVGATKTNRYQDGRLWIRGALAWPDQNIEFAAHGAPELTRSKLRAMWSVFTSDWRWPALLASLIFGPTLVIFIPVLLITAALPGRGSLRSLH